MLWERERERKFQLELLRVQLEHDRNVAILSAGVSIGISFVVFALKVDTTNAKIAIIKLSSIFQPLGDLAELLYNVFSAFYVCSFGSAISFRISCSSDIALPF